MIVNSILELFKSFYGNENKNSTLERPDLSEFLSTDITEEKCDFKGNITSLCDGEGIVDNKIYFSLKDIIYHNFKIGDKVEGSAYKSLHGAWRTVNMNILKEDWDSDNEIECSSSPLLIQDNSSVIGKVSSINNNLICLNESLYFICHLESCISEICLGDWVHCENFKYEDIPKTGSEFPTYKVKPLRQKVIHGSITQINFRSYVINDEIFCDKKIFKSRLRRNDRVIVDVIESDNGRLSWRAIKGKLDPILQASQPFDVNLSSLMEENDINKRRTELIISENENHDEDEIELLQNVIVTNDIKITIEGVGVTDFLAIDITNKSEVEIFLENVVVLSEKKSQLHLDKYFLSKLPYKIELNQSLKVVLQCNSSIVGNSLEICQLFFRNFTIQRKINIVVNSRVLSASHEQRRPFHSIGSGRIIKGEKPYYSAPFIPIKLPYAEIPTKLWDFVLSKDDLTKEFPALSQPLDIHNYIEKLSTLLFLEEIEMDMQIRKFDMPCATFERNGEYLSLTVSGLSEKRPSLLIGDSVIASTIAHNGQSDDIRYEGCIHEVHHNKVLLKFHPEFHSQFSDEDYSIQLCCNRTPFRRCHLAISLVTKQLGGSVMFPTQLNFQLPQICYIDNLLSYPSTKQSIHNFVSTCGIPNVCTIDDSYMKFKDKPKIKIFNPSIYRCDKMGYCIPVITKKSNKVFDLPHLKWFNSKLNCEQKAAVKRILEGSTRPLPYVIYGPPGTGKTVTIVEAILQIFKLVPHSRILVVTPSNSASDLVAERAIRNGCLKKGDLVRIYSFNRSGSTIADDLSEFVDDSYDIQLVVRHRIIVSTVTNSGILYTAKLKNGHFTHVFIDEAGQLTEPEACISLGLVNSCSGQVVLAGDPKQLGPVIISSWAKHFGLGKSLLHRLCSSVLYQPQNVKLKKIYSIKNLNSGPTNDVAENVEEPSVEEVTFEPRLVTLLVRNYRSHPDLLAVPSKLFYHSNLISSASLEVQNRLLSWPELPSPSVPLIFHSVKGQNMQEGDSPSWFNPAEAFQVCRYANSLVKFGLNPTDIGIITPYKKQVEKIRKLLSAFEVGNAKVGPVEEFQGQEKVAIILSTVRSTENLIECDVRHSLGFLQSAERFNVAITRAMSLLVVVGNPFLLKEDPYWSLFISFCVDKGVIKQ